MNKEELLQELSAKIGTGEISREEAISRLNFAPAEQQVSAVRTKRFFHFSVTKMLYFLGAAVVIIGLIVFVSQIWNDIGSFGRILITLGLGLLIAAIGSVLLKQKPGDNIGPIFHLIGGILIPIGAIETLGEFVDFFSLWFLWSFAITFGVIFAFYSLLNFFHKHPILTFFAIVNGTAFVYFLVGAIIQNSQIIDVYIVDIYAFLTMAIGASYLLLARTFRDGWNKYLVGGLYLFGSAGILGAAFSQVPESILWQLLYFLIILGGFFLSAYVRDRGILVISAIFLIVHISYITSEYFADSLGWPISLILLGFIFIGLGYASVTLDKKYISRLN